MLCEDGAGAVDHGVGRRALLAKVHDGVRLEAVEGLRQELKIADVTHKQVDVLARDLSPPDTGTCPFEVSAKAAVIYAVLIVL